MILALSLEACENERTCRVSIEEEIGAHNSAKAPSKAGLHRDAHPAVSAMLLPWRSDRQRGAWWTAVHPI